MLNWTDFSVLLMMLVGPLSGVAAARQHGAGVFSLVLCGAFGVAVAFQIGKTSSKLSYRILGSKTLPAGLQFIGYLFVPMVSLLLVALNPALIVTILYGRA